LLDFWNVTENNSRRMRWAGHVACMGEGRGPKARDHWEDLGVGGRIT